MSNIYFENWNQKFSRENKSIEQILLDNFGITKQNSEKYFNCDIEKHTYSPELFKDYDKTIDRIIKAIKNNEKIMIFGDYDVDGTVGTAILYEILKKAGANVSYILPNRKNDGYGLKLYFIDEIYKLFTNLLITVDTGISAFEEIEMANKLGIDVIITDHHIIPKKLPNAFAIINPKQEDCNYPFSDICGTTIIYKVALGIAKHFFNKSEYEEYKKEKLDLVAFATVADIMPIIDENRVIVKHGLKILKKTKNIGLRKLAEIGKINLDSSDTYSLGFQFGPRINAGGRLSEAYIGLQLLLGKTENAIILEELNQKRKKLVEKAIKEAEERIETKNIIIASSPDWHAGIIGLIAGKLTEKYYLPSIILEENEDKFIASCRSPAEFDIFKFLNQFNEFFEHFGGHSQAAGFSIKKENFHPFKEKALKLGKTLIEKTPLKKSLNIISEIFKEEINLNTFNIIEKFAPFGNGNENPIFLLKNISNIEWKVLGENGNHLFGTIQSANKQIKIRHFFGGKILNIVQKINPCDLVVTLSKNTWNGYTNIELDLVDIRNCI